MNNDGLDGVAAAETALSHADGGTALEQKSAGRMIRPSSNHVSRPAP